jgi:hypothetical protein
VFEFFWLRSTGFPFDDLTVLALPSEVTLPDPTANDEAMFRQHAVQARADLAALLARPWATEALLLSNPDALDRLASLGKDPQRPVNSRQRQRLRLGWSYLQRFHTKNDTCSFFGPLALGRVDTTSPDALRLEPLDADLGPLHRRRVFFEHWAVDRLCTALNQGAHLREVLPHRLLPGCDIVGSTVRIPLGKQISVGAETAELLEAAADGRLDAKVLDAATESARSTAERLVSAEFAVPPAAEHPMRLIAEAVRAAGPVAELRPVREAAEELEAMRQRFEVADQEERRDLLGQMRETLTAVGVDTDRTRGRMYVGRFPVYEDCERNLAVTLGAPLAGVLRERLTPLMRIYRLVAECAAARLHAEYADILASLPTGADGRVDFLVFLSAVRGEHHQRLHDTVVTAMRATLRSVWAELARDASADELPLTEAGLDRIAAALTAATADHGRFADVLGVGVVSPDVLLAARNADGVRAGDFRIVVGEVHPGVLTALQPVTLPFFHEAALTTVRQEVNDLLAPGRVLLAGSSQSYQRSRIDWPVVPNLWEVTLPGSTSRCAPDRQIPAGRGRVIVRDGLILFLDRRSGREEDMVTVLSTDLHRVLFAVANDVVGGGLPQRVLWRELEIKRRSWSFDTADLPSASQPAESFADYVALASWARAHGLPRHGFFLADTEPKPMYVDWRSPLAVDTFAKTIHQARRVRLTEMSPGPDELWLTGVGGRFCSELRLSFVV